ncbi:hypothetical protein BTUL_0105g00230 [Botrytis tulipae]|uniref:Uncharacterized protein n=1 Tax=Botrytis tulipae TaxID=87230 RepID=A0A4Z1EMQ7_9HELO|nr:hypothetical protein BTUL_0105g00230 [Botrytis tulipae]
MKMTAASPKKRDHLVPEDENSQPRHQDEVWSKESFCATSMLESDIDPRSMAQELSTNGQRLSSSHDTHRYDDVKRTVPDLEVKQQAKRDERDTDQDGEKSVYGNSFRNFLAGLSKGYSPMPDREQINSRRSSIGSLQPSPRQQRVHERTASNFSSARGLDEICRLRREVEGLLIDNDRHHAARGKIEGDLRAVQRQNDTSEDLVRKLQAKNQQLEFEKQEIEEKHSTFIRKQQEASFNQMTTSRWMPVEDSKVIGDLDRLKRDMRNWAKKASVNDMDTLLGSLGQRERAALKEALTHVVVFENDELPQGLSAKKSPSLFLTALLTHHVYKTLFKSPFFFINGNIMDGRFVLSEYRMGLEVIYRKGRYSNEGDAHIWRSDFLRLQLPPMTPETSEHGQDLHRMTETQIAEVANRQASDFLEGAAQYLIGNEGRETIADKLRAIYREAASVSYMLWTRRTTLKILTLKDIAREFHPEIKHLVPHSSVNYEKHEDQLRGRAISIIVHPLLLVHGTDDAKDYNHRRVWAPAEVWLDSSVSSVD